MNVSSKDNVSCKRATKRCVAFGCNNARDKHSRAAGISFHLFPMSKPERVKVWEHAMHRQGFHATKWSSVCSVHFTPESFDRTGRTVRLRENAVPTIFDLPPHLQKTIEKKRKPPRDRSSTVDATGSRLPPSSCSVSDVTSIRMDHSYILESPHKLKRKLENTTLSLESMRKRLRSSQQKNRRLRRKMSTYEDESTAGHCTQYGSDVLKYTELLQEVRGVMYPATLMVKPQYMKFKNASNENVLTFPVGEINELHWICQTKGCCIKVIQKNDTTHHLDGFRDADYEKLSAYVQCYYQGHNLEKKNLALEDDVFANTPEFRVNEMTEFESPQSNRNAVDRVFISSEEWCTLSAGVRFLYPPTNLHFAFH